MAKRASPKRKVAAKTAVAKRKSAATKASIKNTRKAKNYPIAETLAWVASGEKLLIKWGAIRSPGAKRVANTVGQILMVLEALTALRKQ